MAQSGKPSGNLFGGRPALRFVVLFALLVLALTGLTRWSLVDDNLVFPYTAWLARLTAGVFEFFGYPATAKGTGLYHSGFAVDLRRGCDGVVATVVLLSALFAFPAGWSARLKGAALGFCLIFILNLARVFVLFGLGVAGRMELFHFVHTYVAQLAIIVAAMVFWIHWTGTTRPARA